MFNFLNHDPAEMTEAPCICCASRLRFPAHVTVVRCMICETITDFIPLAVVEASGPALDRSLFKDYVRSVESGEMSVDGFIQLVGSVFERWDAVNECCRLPRKSSDSQLPSNVEPLEIDLVQLRTFYRDLITFATRHESVRLIQKILASFSSLVHRPGRHLQSANDIRFLVVLLEFPLLTQSRFLDTDISDLTRNVASRVFGLLSCLSNVLHHQIVNWFAFLYSDSELQKRIDSINTYLSQRVSFLMTVPQTTYSSPPGAKYHTDWQVRAAAKCMALLHAANALRPLPSYHSLTRPLRMSTSSSTSSTSSTVQVTDRTRLPISLFYNITVDYVDLGSDFIRWQKELSNSDTIFCFCQYPFLLSLGSKIRILEWDATREMTDRFKAAFLRTTIHGLVTDPFLSITVRRSHLIHDSLVRLSNSELDLKKKLKISFVEEDGVDAGGLTKEWFLLLVRDLFDLEYGMFVAEEDSRLLWFSTEILWDEEVDQSFYLVGIVIGLAIYNGILLDVPFPLACYKKLLGYNCDLDDLKQLRPSVGASLHQMLEYEGDDFEDVFGLTFEVEYQNFGELCTEELIPHGSDIAVTRSNIQDYISHYVDWIFNRSVQKQYSAFHRGFMRVCGGNALSLFKPEEIEQMVRGETELDLKALESVTVYEGISRDDLLIQWLWKIIHGLDMQRKQKFLLFVTGSDRVPATGIETMAFKISLVGPDSENLPSSHTCFNQLCIHRYSSKERLESKLLKAIDYASGFGLK